MTQPLGDPRLEAAAQILFAGSDGDWPTLQQCRRCVRFLPHFALALLAEARKQTGADDLAEALRQAIEMMPLDTIEQSVWRTKARAALAKHEWVG